MRDNSGFRESFEVEDLVAPCRLDRYLTENFPDFSRTYFQRLVEEGHVLLNGKVAKKATPIKLSDRIEIEFTSDREIDLTPENIPLEILFEDESILVINKPANLVVHPAPGHSSGTLVNALLHHCQTLGGEPSRPGLVHRLDKETSGLMVIAKNELAHRRLVNAFANRKVEKSYLAISRGHLLEEKLVLAPIGRDKFHRQKMDAPVEGGKAAETRFTPLAKSKETCLIHAFPKTGRTHQIRLHLRLLSLPILGDKLYSSLKKGDPGRQMLHAFSLGFDHPILGNPLTFKIAPPKDFIETLHRHGILETSQIFGS